MDLREILERREALTSFWESNISSLEKLKPSELVKKEEVTTIQQSVNNPGVQVFDVGDQWRTWTKGYAELLTLKTHEIQTFSKEELGQIYGSREGGTAAPTPGLNAPRPSTAPTS